MPPTTQSARNVIAAIKRETTFATPAASGAGAYLMPLLDSPGLHYGRGKIASGRRRADQIAAPNRLGAKEVNGSFNSELMPGGAIDLLIESTSRGTWSAALAPAAASVTNTATVITRAAGSFLTDGYKNGDIITPSGDTTTPNNNLRLRVVGVAALTMTIASTPTGPLTVQAVARSVTFTRLKKVMAPGTNALINTSYSVEQYEGDQDWSELFYGNRVVGASMSLKPNSPVSCVWTMAGVGRNIIDTAAAPYFTNPSDLTSDSLIADDSWIRYKGSDVGYLTGMDLDFPIANARQGLVGQIESPDIYMNDMSPKATVTAARTTIIALQDFDAETEFEILTMLTLPGVDPDPAMAIFMPRVKLLDINAPFLGGDAAKIETRELQIMTHPGDTDNDNTAFVFLSSGP